MQLSLINSLKLKPETWNSDLKTLDHTRKKNRINFCNMKYKN